MTFEEWFKTSGYWITTLAHLFGLSEKSMSKICKGTPPRLSTVLRIIRIGKRFKLGITLDMFPLVYVSGSHMNKTVPTKEAHAEYLQRKKRTPVKASTT